MAYQVKNISPLDLRKVGIGISLPFNGPAGGFNTTYDTSTQLKSNILNYFLTNNNERVMNTTFGGNLRALIFEQLTEGSLDGVKISIEQIMQREFPNIQVKNVKVLGYPDQNLVNITINYSVPNTNINDELIINFE